MSQHWKEAKPKYLKAIDFTLGLLRRLERQGKTLPGASIDTVVRRLIDMRKAAQSGFRLDTLLENKKHLSGRGAAVLSALEAEEAKLLPSERNLAAFIKPFSDTTNQYLQKQARIFEDKIAQELWSSHIQVQICGTRFVYTPHEATQEHLGQAG